MNAALVHRGPDHAGQKVECGVGLASSRLAIIDLATGDQPITIGDGAVCVVLNGEIYNYRELRDGLKGKGHSFATRSDTEVLAVGYLEYGIEVLHRLKGMFAFAIHDRRSGSLYLARDRFGEKPLVYWHDQIQLVFSSEITSLTHHNRVPRKLNREGLGHYLRYGYVPWPGTLFDGITEVPPGAYLQWKDGTVRVVEYYRPNYEPDPALADLGVATEAVRTALEEAVRRQMVSDVPLGAFLSGGIDSGGVVAMMRRVSDQPVHTFTVKFPDIAYDEADIARKVSDHLGTEHHEIDAGEVAFAQEDLQRIVRHVGQPFVDSSAIPTHIISKAVRPHVKVCLTGDGGDEMFAGYPIFRLAPAVDRIARIPAPIRTAMGLGSALLARVVPGEKGSLFRRTNRAIEFARCSVEERLSSMVSIFTSSELSSLVDDPELRSMAMDEGSPFLDLPCEAASWSELRRRMYILTRQQLPQDMLVKTDRMSMANSLELRAPLLDPDLAALSMRLPDAHLVSGRIQKLVLREAIRPYLPEEVFSQPKSGFRIPLHCFQNDEYVEMARALLSNPTPTLRLLNQDAVSSVVTRALERSSDRADISIDRANHQLWSLMMLAEWDRQFKVAV
jgi:asparagine synthase (glutamine-hydrolysing)